jgi:hypothetical protein
VITHYDPDFSSIQTSKIDSEDMDQYLRQSLIFFFQKHSNVKAKHITKFLNEAKNITNPCYYLNCLSDWSRSMFFESLHQRDPSRPSLKATNLDNSLEQKPV